MVRRIVLLVGLLAASAAWAYGAFCDGFQDGYKAGYCYGKFGCIAPIPPICPIPEIGQDSYRGGYNRGFLMGVADQ